MSEVGKFIEIENRLLVAEGMTATSYEISLRVIKKFLKLIVVMAVQLCTCTNYWIVHFNGRIT